MCVYTDYLTKRHRVGLLNNYSDYFFGLFLDHFIGGGGRPLVLREGWDAVYQYSGRDGGQQSVFIEGGVEDELFVGREGREVDVLVTATDLWSVHRIIQIILRAFRLTTYVSKFWRWAAAFL